MLYILDNTIDNGLSYGVLGPYSTPDKAKRVVSKIFRKYNKELAKKKEEKISYDDAKWKEINPGYLVYPFGPGAEYRIRSFEVDDTSFLNIQKLDNKIVNQSLADADQKQRELELINDICNVIV